MRDFRLYADEKDDNYITKYVINDSNISATISNGKYEKPIIFDQIENNDENIENLNRRMTTQLKRAINNKDRFVLKRNISRVITTTGVIVGSLSVFTHDRYIAAAGAIALGGAIFAGLKARSKSKDLEEIKKAELISDNMHNLKHLEDYPNALAASEEDFVVNAEETDLLITKVDDKDVVNANRIDEYDLEDLEKLIKNIDREKNMRFIKTKKNSCC